MPCLTSLNHLYKALSHLVEFLQIGLDLAELLTEHSLVCRELLQIALPPLKNEIFMAGGERAIRERWGPDCFGCHFLQDGQQPACGNSPVPCRCSEIDR